MDVHINVIVIDVMVQDGSGRLRFHVLEIFCQEIGQLLITVGVA